MTFWMTACAQSTPRPNGTFPPCNDTPVEILGIHVPIHPHLIIFLIVMLGIILWRPLKDARDSRVSARPD